MKKKIIVLAAHPDDETLGCGATISKLSKQGHNIKLITFTDGVSARDVKDNKNRKKSLKKVSKILGIEDFKCGNFPDNKMDSVPLLDICKFIENEVIEYPDIIFTHHPGCLNIDHNIVYRAAITVFRPQYKKEIEINCFEVPSSTEWNPNSNFRSNLYIDVEGFVEKKIEALKIYDEEMRTYPHPRSYNAVVNKMKSSGNEVNFNFAERFQTIRRINI
jgi:LmbE family N-acetylglucosaminyl deacetylase